MEEKLRSYFYLGSLENLIKYQGKKSEESSLLQERALVMMGKPTSLSLPNLEVLRSYQQRWEPLPLSSDPLEEILSLAMSFNNNEEASLVDSLKPLTLEKKLLLLCSLLKLRRSDIVEGMLKEAMAQDEEEGAFGLLLAVTLFLKGDFEEAGGVANELISRYGDSPVTMNIYALALLQEGNHSKAETNLLKALGLARNLGVQQYVELTLRNLIACKRVAGENFNELEQ